MHLGGIRMLAAIIGVGVALATAITLPLWLIREAWYYAGLVLGGRFPHLWLPDWQSVQPLWSYPPFSWGGQAIPFPPDNEWLFTTSLTLLAVGMVVVGALYAWVPLRYRIKAAAGHSGMPLTAKHHYQLYVDGLAAKYQLSYVQVRRIPTNGIVAFVMSTPMNRHAIAVSDGLFAQPPEVVRWILAHEVAHVKHGDTKSGTFWVLAFRSVSLLDSLRASLMTGFLRFLHAIPILRLFVWPLYALFVLLTKIARLGRWVGSMFFMVIDRWISRRMEFRADRFAAEHEGPEPGMRFFQYLVGQFEPTFDLLATHPSNVARYEALEKQLSSNSPLHAGNAASLTSSPP